MMQEIKLTQIQENSGQVEGLPQNPRQIDAQKFELLKDNITKYPEMLSFRGLMVYEYKKSTFVVIGGNMRFRALKDLQHKSAPCVVLPKETPIEKLRAYAMLDNNNFGQWDYALLDEWDAEELQSWGLESENILSEDEINALFEDGEQQTKDNNIKLCIVAKEEEKEQIKEIEDYVKSNYPNLKVD